MQERLPIGVGEVLMKSRLHGPRLHQSFPVCYSAVIRSVDVSSLDQSCARRAAEKTPEAGAVPNLPSKRRARLFV
jgi:hypothetical protein